MTGGALVAANSRFAISTDGRFLLYFVAHDINSTVEGISASLVVGKRI